jgi:predicted RND superfamily exporter protein
MAFYDSMADGVSKRAGTFVAVILIVTGIMFASYWTMDQGYDASSDPEGPAFEARTIIGDEFTATAHQIPYLVEAKGNDVLSKEVLAEVFANEEAYRSSDIYRDYRYEGYDSNLDIPFYGIYTVADGVQDVLVGSFNTTLDEASPDMVKVALHFFIEGSPGIRSTFSKDNSSEVRDISVGPMQFEDVKVWQAKAFINAIMLDYNKVDEGLPEVLDQEATNLEVLDLISGEERSYRTYGIALDLNTEINAEAQTSVMLVFIAVIAILVIVFVSLRSGAETLLAGLMLLFLLFWIFGSVRLLDLGNSQFIDLLLPIAILSLGVDYALHSLHRYHEERGKEPDPRGSFRRSTRMVGPALFIAMVTTAVAFFSNASSELQAVQQFGLAAGLAIVFAFLLLGLALPAMRMLMQARKHSKEVVSEDDEEGKAPRGKGDGPSREPHKLWRAFAKIGTRPVLVIVLVVLITIPLAYRGMQIEGKMPVEDFINSESDFVVGLEKMNEHTKVGESGLVLVQADFADPVNLRAIDTFEDNIRDNEEAIPPLGTLTVADVVRDFMENDNVFPMYGNTTLRDHLGLEDSDGDGYPDTRDQVEGIYEFIIGQDNGWPMYMVGDRLVMQPTLLVTSMFKWNDGDRLDKTILVVSIPRSGDASKVAEGRVELEEDLEYLDDMGFASNDVADGPYYVITDVGTYNPFTREEQFSALTDSMAKSVFISIGICLVVMVVLFRSLKLGIASILPMVLVVAWLYGVMEITGNYLNSVTVTIAAISIGVGVDYAIHVTHRFREEHEKHKDYEKAMTATMASTGNALAFSAGSTFVGFFIIGFSPMTMFSKFGFLTAMMIGMAFIAAVMVLPAFLALTVRGEGLEGPADEEATPPEDEG